MAIPGNPAISIRLATTSDIDEIVRLRWEFSSEDDRRPTESRESFRARLAADLASFLASPRWSIWVAEDVARNGTLLGTVCLERVEKLARPYPRASAWGYVTNVYVAPSVRNAGLGTRLLQAAIDAAQREGLEMLLLWPSDRAVPFYRRLGFEPVDALELPLDRPT
ncbi:MAG TPA: GNAT family N-acetyltransferase [Candidatus Limnocylindria bacterium]|nr:GNAT family N-acetyltransferase [Candidatus Limnocylindria bacterium]